MQWLLHISSTSSLILEQKDPAPMQPLLFFDHSPGNFVLTTVKNPKSTKIPKTNKANYKCLAHHRGMRLVCCPGENSILHSLFYQLDKRNL